jgi:serine/threonine protein kinase/tetratricopeptide (TPR) repeat protein
LATEPDPPDAILDAVKVDPAATLEYDSFGPYRILSLLGEGGMGAVYLAEQTQPLQRQVALKVVKLGLNSTQILSRFSYERQALALMEHPNIARVYDAGASEKGRPYFVMEYVDGLPITQYCDRHRLTTGQRLELFVPVCQALQHAHQKGVIHRDIKPSNVMVTEVDGRPVPKVIDFGIARATEQRNADTVAFTQLGQFLGTPEYMSPEQADLVTGDVDTSSDVYSLGVLLYELLIGAVPFDAQMLRRAGLSELLRIVREEEAIPMTAKLTGMGESATKIAGLRRTDPDTLRRLVGGDLNWIVMRAMEKDRRRRYLAASELAADIQRHLDDRPVLASPPSPVYRARKFVRRHKFSVLAAAGVLATLVVGIVATTWQAAIARRERAEAVAARKLAETRLDDVHTLADSMLFEINSDVKDLAGGTKAREALVRLGQQYLNKEVAVSETDPHRRQELAQAFMELGDLQGAPGESNLRDVTGARQSYGRSVAILEAESVSHPLDANLRHLLTLVYVRQAQLDESAASARATLERASKSADIFVAQWPGDLQGLRDRAEVLGGNEQFEAAVELRQRILASNPKDPSLRWELAHAQLALGTSIASKHRLPALDWLKKSADGFEALNREEPANVRYQRDRAVALGTMTRIQLNLSLLTDAVASARQSVSILEQLTASDPRNASFRLDLSAARVALSNAYYFNGQTNEALENAALAVSIQEDEAAHNPDNPDFPRQAAVNYRNAGKIKNDLKDYRGAVEQFRKAEGVDRKLLAHYAGRVEFAEALRADLDSIGATYLAIGDAPSALRAYRDAYQVAESAAGPQTDEGMASLAMAHQGLASALGALLRWDDALTEQRAAVAIDERRGSDKRALAHSREELSKLYEARGDYPAAIAASETALPFVQADYDARPDDESRVELLNLLSCLRTQYAGAAEYERAVVAGAQIVEIMSHNGIISRARANRDYGDTLLLSGRRDASIEAFHRAVAVMNERPIEQEVSPLYRNELAGTFLYIATDLTAARREDESAALLKRIQPVMEDLVRKNPGNGLYLDTLLRIYRASAITYQAAGDAAKSLEFELLVVKLEPAPVLPGDLYERGIRLARIATLERSEVRRRSAVAMLQQAARAGRQQWSADKSNRKALEIGKLAEAAAASGAQASGVEAAAHAVEQSRRSVASQPSVENRLELARKLLSYGDAVRADVSRSRDCYLEGLNILSALRKSHELPASANADLIALTNNLAAADDRLHLISRKSN